MKLLQVSDLHIDSKMETNFSSTQAKERNNEILVTFEKLFDVLEKENYSAMLIAGDMFDTKKITSKSFSYIIELIRKHENKLFFYIAGNHDSETKLINNNENIPQNLIIFGTNFSKYKLSEKVNIGGLQITKSNCLTIEKQIDFNPNEINILLLHGALSKTSTKADNENIFIGDLKNKNIDYLAIGHIHSYSSGKIDNRCTYAYSGCLEPRGFDEFGDKGYISISIDENNHKVSHEFVKFAKRKFHEINIDITSLNSSRLILDKIYESIQNISNDDIIKITLTGEYDEYLVKGLDLIESELSRKYYYIKLVDKTKLKISLEDYKGNFSLKGLFIKQVLESKKIPESIKDDVILTGIKALSSEEID